MMMRISMMTMMTIDEDYLLKSKGSLNNITLIYKVITI